MRQPTLRPPGHPSTIWANVKAVRALTSRLVLMALLAGAPELVHADQLTSEQAEGERGYLAVEELSYEAILDASDGYSATLRLRTALHNTSANARDAVHNMALPPTAQLRAIRVAHDGQWTDGAGTIIKDQPERRDPGTVFARALPPSERGRLPAAEVVTFGLEPSTTIQVELVVTVYPRLRGNNWELDLPARGVQPQFGNLRPARDVQHVDVVLGARQARGTEQAFRAGRRRRRGEQERASGQYRTQRHRICPSLAMHHATRRANIG